MEKSCRKCAPKASHRLLCNSVKNPKHAINSFKNKIFSKTIIKKLTLFFLLKLVLFNGQDYEKQKGPGTKDQSLFRLQNKFSKIPLLVMYYVTKFDDVI